MPNTPKTLLCLKVIGFSILLSLTTSTVFANETTASNVSTYKYSELPNSRDIFTQELAKQNKALRTCKGRKQCRFLIEYTRVLRSHIETLSYNTEELAYIRKLYGNASYRYIKENRDLIELQFDEWLTKELLTKTEGRILSEDNGFSKQEVSDIYSDYVSKAGFHTLYEKRRTATTSKMRALYAYQLYLLFSDVRLYHTGK